MQNWIQIGDWRFLAVFFSPFPLVPNFFLIGWFGSLQKATQVFNEHVGTHNSPHNQTLDALHSRETGSVIEPILHEACQLEQEESRKALLTIISAIRYLATNEIALRGSEKEEGNLWGLLGLLSKYVPELEKQLKKSQSYLSPQIQNELIEVMAHLLQRKQMETFQGNIFFALLADEATAITAVEELSLCVRTVGSDFKPQEIFLGFVEVDSLTGASLAKTIETTLLRFNLPLERCRAQAFDGASNMAGKYQGVRAQIQKIEPRALYVHCMNHRLNLVLQEVASSFPIFRDSLSLVHEVAKFLGESPKRKGILKEISGEGSLKTLSQTRWVCRVQAIDALLEKYEEVLQALEEISATERREVSTIAAGLSKRLENGEVYLGIALSSIVFSIVERVAEALQKSGITLGEARDLVDSLDTSLSRLEESDLFEVKWQTMEKTQLPKPTLPRKRVAPKRLEKDPEPEFPTAKDRIRYQFTTSLRAMKEELTNRFPKDLDIILKAEQLLISAMNDKIREDLLRDVCDFWDFNTKELQQQLSLLPSFKLKEKSIDGLVDVLSEGGVRFLNLDQLEALLKILVLIPPSTAGCERSFSLMRRLFNWLRGRMSQARLTQLAVIAAHSDNKYGPLPKSLQLWRGWGER